MLSFTFLSVYFELNVTGKTRKFLQTVSVLDIKLNTYNISVRRKAYF